MVIGARERPPVAVAEIEGEAGQHEEAVHAQIALQDDGLDGRHAAEGMQGQLQMVEHHPADQQGTQPRERGKPLGLSTR